MNIPSFKTFRVFVRRTFTFSLIWVIALPLFLNIALPIFEQRVEAQATVGVSRTILSAYEVMRQWGSSSCPKGGYDPDVYRAKTQQRGFPDYASESDMDDTRFFGYKEGREEETINVSISADSSAGGDGRDGRIRCVTAFNFIARDIFGSRNNALDALFDRDKFTGSGNDRKYPSRRQNQSQSEYINGRISQRRAEIERLPGFSNSYNIYRRQQAIDAFKACWKWDLPSGRDPKDADKYDASNYSLKIDGGGNAAANTGFAAEVLVEGSYGDGRTNCTTLRNYVFTNKLLDDGVLDEFEVALKATEIRELLKSKNGYRDLLTFCINPYSPAPTGILALDMSTLLDVLSNWLAAGGTGIIPNPRITGAAGQTGPPVSAENAAKIKDCLLRPNVYGQTLADLINAEVSSSPDNTDGTSAGDIDANCAITGGALTWILCPIYDLAEEAFMKIGEYMENLLDYKFGEDTAIRDAWSSMRTIANVLFVIALLLIIISQAVTGKM